MHPIAFRRLLGLGICCALTGACAAPHPGLDFAATLASAPAGPACRLVLRDGRIVRCATPIPEEAIPAAALRTSEEYVQPGGQLVFAGREWATDGTDGGYRLIKHYHNGDGAAPTRRSVLVAADGTVLERTHEIPPADGPARALEAVRALGIGRPTSLEVVQGRPDTPDRYRYELVDEQDRRFVVVCSAAGDVLERGRLTASEVTSLE